MAAGTYRSYGPLIFIVWLVSVAFHSYAFFTGVLLLQFGVSRHSILMVPVSDGTCLQMYFLLDYFGALARFVVVGARGMVCIKYCYYFFLQVFGFRVPLFWCAFEYVLFLCVHLLQVRARPVLLLAVRGLRHLAGVLALRAVDLHSLVGLRGLPRVCTSCRCGLVLCFFLQLVIFGTSLVYRPCEPLIFMVWLVSGAFLVHAFFVGVLLLQFCVSRHSIRMVQVSDGACLQCTSCWVTSASSPAPWWSASAVRSTSSITTLLLAGLLVPRTLVQVRLRVRLLLANFSASWSLWSLRPPSCTAPSWSTSKFVSTWHFVPYLGLDRPPALHGSDTGFIRFR